MVYLRKVCVNDSCYYYLFHVKRLKGSFRKYKKFVGKTKPNAARLESLQKSFLESIKKGDISPSGYTDINVVEELQKVQQSNGYITTKDIVRLSKEHDIPVVELVGIASFYTQFTFKKPGKHTLRVCNGTACHVKNSMGLSKEVTSQLGIKAGEVTEDGFIGFESVNCIGACARAPAIMVDDTVYGEVDARKLKTIITSLYDTQTVTTKPKVQNR